ncbi:MAG: CHAD domain-containing protein [Solirubrobacteraceae bacterium]|nr:CHAD domain-containing protein [Solirubrobacteraceae bacterium]
MKARRIKGLDPQGPLGDQAARIVRVRLEEVLSFTPRALDPDEIEALHDMRIAAKRLRYALEATGDLFGPYAHKATGRARDLQDLIGEIHDCDVMLPRVLALMAEVRRTDAQAVRAAAGDAEDLPLGLAAQAPNASAWRGLHTLVTHLAARRALLFERFLVLWTELGREGFVARLEFALDERAATEM